MTKTIKMMATLMLMSIGAQAQQAFGEIRGILKDELNAIVPFATVKLMQDNRLLGGTESDMEGNYKYKPLEPGTYDVLVMESGHETKKIKGVKVIPGDATYLNIKLKSNTLGTVVVTAIIEEDYTETGVETTMYSMESLSSEEILHSSGFESGGSLLNVIGYMTSEALQDANGEYHFRGGRGDANGFYFDGVKVLDMNMVPTLAIENVTMFTGGVPAMYGDVLGGVVIVTSKSYFSGIREKNMRNQRIREQMAEKKARRAAEKEAASGIIYN
jgi:hypothetical protein